MTLLHTSSFKLQRWTWRGRINVAGVPLLALCFSIEFLMGLTEMIRAGGLPWLGLWGVGPVIMGALFAEEDWVNYPRWPSFAGMLIWGSIPWLLAIRYLPWSLGLCLVWLALRALRR
jgi:hypothetical protein